MLRTHTHMFAHTYTHRHMWMILDGSAVDEDKFAEVKKLLETVITQLKGDLHSSKMSILVNFKIR